MLLLFCKTVSSLGQTKAKIVLGVAPLTKSAHVKEQHSQSLDSVIKQQAKLISGLTYVALSSSLFEKIRDDPSRIIEAVKEIGATHFLIGEIVEFSVKTIKITKPLIEGPVLVKMITIILNVQVVDVSTLKVEAAKMIRSDLNPLSMHPVSPISDKIASMGGKFREYIQTWCNEKMRTYSKKTN